MQSEKKEPFWNNRVTETNHTLFQLIITFYIFIYEAKNKQSLVNVSELITFPKKHIYVLFFHRCVTVTASRLLR
jgi:hypothetical protein